MWQEKLWKMCNANRVQLAASHGNYQTVEFLLDQGGKIDISVGYFHSTDLSGLMTSWTIPTQYQPDRIKTMKLLLNAGSHLDCSYQALVKSWMASPYDLLQAFATYEAHAKRTGALSLKRFMDGNTLLDPFHRALYTYQGPLKVQFWTNQIVNAALEFDLELGTDLEHGILYLDGPLKYSIWFDVCSSGAVQSSLTLGIKNLWYDELVSNLKYVYFKGWFDALIVYNAKHQAFDYGDFDFRCNLYSKPTLQAFLGGHTSPWFSALRDAGVDVHAVAAQTFSWTSGEEAAFIVDQRRRQVSRLMRPFQRKYLLPSYYQEISTKEDLQRVMVAVFKENGYNLDAECADLHKAVTFTISMRRLLLAILALLLWKILMMCFPQENRKHA